MKIEIKMMMDVNVARLAFDLARKLLEMYQAMYPNDSWHPYGVSIEENMLVYSSVCDNGVTLRIEDADNENDAILYFEFEGSWDAFMNSTSYNRTLLDLMRTLLSLERYGEGTVTTSLPPALARHLVEDRLGIYTTYIEVNSKKVKQIKSCYLREYIPLDFIENGEVVIEDGKDGYRDVITFSDEFLEREF